jgi:predicted ATP-grasp superfamily ATP-dependent carboligase
MSRHERFARAGGAAPLACVLGSMDLIRPLGLAGLRCIAIARPGSPALYSRFTVARRAWPQFAPDDAALVDELMRLAAAQRVPPLLFYEEDAQLLLISRNRERLARAFRFVIADAELVEDLVDKARFHALSARLGLPVPRTRLIRPAVEAMPQDLAFPLIVKPVTRDEAWGALGGAFKALRLADAEVLRALWPRLAAAGADYLAQQEIAGPESAIESYHVYVDRFGAIAGEFTGRKIRTWPLSCGHSTALAISDAADVAALGRALTRKLNLRGVAKFDFKRAADGTLHLLEVNPRFNLWHHLGAVAGVNLPALVHADLTGSPRPATAQPRVDAAWCTLRDVAAARACGMGPAAWLRFVSGCAARSAIAWDDPLPLLRGGLARLLGASAHLPGGSVGLPGAPARDPNAPARDPGAPA